MYQKTNKKGFTLIELLVTISIIGILSSISLTSLSVVKTKARDGKRLAELKTLQTALTLYNSDHYNDTYSVPFSGGVSSSCDVNWDSSGTGTALYPLIQNGQLAKLPSDPLNTSQSCYYYSANTDGRGACVYTKLERTGAWVAAVVGDPDTTTYSPSGYHCGGVTVTDYIGFAVGGSSVGGGDGGSDSGSGPTDADSDGIDDAYDNCLGIQNSDQGDSNGNGIGDVCESGGGGSDGGSDSDTGSSS